MKKYIAILVLCLHFIGLVIGFIVVKNNELESLNAFYGTIIIIINSIMFGFNLKIWK